VARNSRQHRIHNGGWLGARRSEVQPYRENELAVDIPDPQVFGPYPDGYSHTPPPPPPGPPVTSHLRTGGIWETIHTHPSASSTTITTANLLASELGRISSSTAPVRQSWTGETAGVRVGLLADWQDVQHTFATSDWGTWDWALVVVSGQAYILGRTDRGLQVAIRRVLHALGYHMLTTVWEVFPTLGADVPMVATEIQSIRFRFLQALGNTTNITETSARNDTWLDRNAIINDGLWGYGHSYVAIKNAKIADFNAHPQWQAGGLSGAGTKFCAYEPGLVADCLSYTLTQFNNATRKCSSLSASDGSDGWDLVCSGTNEQALYAASTRQLHIANQVQASIRTALGPDKHVGVQCYADTSYPGPQEAIDPDILVIWTSGFIAGGLSPEQAIQNYFNMGAQTHAPYGYFSEWLWTQDLPCAGRATQRDELETEYQRLTGLQYPAIGLSGESSPAWVPYGQWYWSIAGTMFGEVATARWDSWASIAFPHATALAQIWYDIVGTPTPMSSDLMHRMADAARNLIRALPLGSAERERALDLGRYTNYANLWRPYKANPSATTLEPVLQWVFRDRHRDIVAYAAPYQLPTWATDRQAVAAKHGLADLTTSSNVWPDVPTTDSEILAALDNIVATNALIPFATVSYDNNNLAHIAGLTFSGGTNGSYTAQVKDYEWWYHSSGADIFTFQSGIVRSDKGSTRVQIIEFATQNVDYDVTIPPDKVVRFTNDPSQLPPVQTKAQVMYKIRVTNAVPGFKMTVSSGTAVVYEATDDFSIFTGSFSGYVYVPKGTTKLGFFAQSGTIRLSTTGGVDQHIFDGLGNDLGTVLTASNNFYYAPVTDDTDGQLWRVHSPSNKFRPYTIPPQIAHAPSEVMLPREVADADGLQLADATPPPVPQFPVVTFSSTLVKPTTPLTASGPVGFINYEGFDGSAMTLGTGASVDYTVQAGIVSATKGNSIVTVVDTTTNLTVATWSAPPDKTVYTFSFTGVLGRQYRLDIDNNGGCRVAAPAGVPLVWPTPGRTVLNGMFIGSYNLYCYVPKGTTHAEGWFDGGTVKVYDNANKLVTTFTASSGYYNWAIPTGKDGTVFRLVGMTKRVGFSNIPDWLALRPGDLAVPQDVAIADGLI
jgi:hypothetical protein